ncbi:hypothetical protein PAEPH01_0815 [Pancytospora epiphaga]|nr:hypothetical protein PAEPH01_0815 [Pancytospora epiphaga]
MNNRKIDLADLVEMKDGTVIDMGVITDSVDPGYRLVTEEVETFIERPIAKVKSVKNSFSSFIPSTALKESIEEVLKVRSVQEDRLKKHMQFEFDRKMQRIKRIKSRTYRKLHRREKLRKEQALQIDSDEGSQGSSENGESPSDKEESSVQGGIMDFRGSKNEPSEELMDPQFGIVKEAFRDPTVEGNEKEFLEEKYREIENDAPLTTRTVLPGWDDWAGEGIEIKMTAQNTVMEKKEGILPYNRKDYGKHNVIINEHVTLSDKYKTSLPYGYSPTEYKEQLKTPISMETNSFRVFKRFLKVLSKKRPVSGENIKPSEFEPEY